MPSFSQTSLSRLATCHPLLQTLFNEVIRHTDCTILEGSRDRETQERYLREGRTTVGWGVSKHNYHPSKAADVVPYPLTKWPDPNDPKEKYARDLGRMYMFVGIVRGVAASLGIPIRCGADWDGDMEVKDQNFHDLPHFELVGEFHESRIPE